MASHTTPILALCLLALAGGARADQWDDAAARLAAREHARVVDRRGDESGFVIVLDQALAPKGVVITVMDGKPSVTYRFPTVAAPGDPAYAMMGRAAGLVLGGNADAIEAAMRLAEATALHGLGAAPSPAHGYGTAPFDGGFAACLIVPETPETSCTAMKL